MDRKLWPVLLTILISMATFSSMIAFFGCSVPAQTAHTGWHPKDKAEMRQLIGQTVIDAAHQYNKEMRKRTAPSGKLRLEPNPVRGEIN